MPVQNDEEFVGVLAGNTATVLNPSETPVIDEDELDDDEGDSEEYDEDEDEEFDDEDEDESPKSSSEFLAGLTPAQRQAQIDKFTWQEGDITITPGPVVSTRK